MSGGAAPSSADADADVIVVGSGSAGAIIAARLAEDPTTRVLLLEAGPKDGALVLRAPAAMRYAYNAARFNWRYETEPEPHLNGRRLAQPRGRVLGGSSSINGQLYLRGHPSDYDAWADAGARGWAYADVLPYFTRLETRVDGASAYRGASGPIRAATSALGPLERAFLAAGREAGYLETDDVNGAQQDGFGRFPKNAAEGRRFSTAEGYLRRPPANLRIETGALVGRVRIERGRATGVELIRDGARRTLTAAREVVLAAGVYNSPALLMRSGVGPGAHLQALGLEVVHHAPGVGENLMDHPLTSVQAACVEPVTLYGRMGFLSKARGVLQWLVRRDGLLANNHFDVVAFVRSKAGVRAPNLQIALFAIAVAEGRADFLRRHAFQLQFSNQRPLSRGTVRLRSPDPTDPPCIQLNLLGHPQDLEEMTAGLRLSRELLRQPALAALTGEELSPGRDVASDDEIEAWLRAQCQSSYHPCGSCKMGLDAMAVVDPECRVYGVAGLRVADASIMPIIPSANLNCPTMMIGEKAADLIADKPPPPPSNLPYFVDPNWRTAQR